jgi:hypothetical protein
MSDDKTKKDYRDRSRINVGEIYEVKYWTDKWCISREQLNDAIRATDSTSVKKVEEYLKKNKVIQY